MAAVCLSVSPAMARVEDGTSDLLKTLDENGIHITFNERCEGEYYGLYRFVGMKREMHLCPATVLILSIIVLLDTRLFTLSNIVSTLPVVLLPMLPLLIFLSLWSLLTSICLKILWTISKLLTPGTLGCEFEANLLEEIMTADDLSKLFVKACVGV